MSRIAPYWKAVVAFIAPGAVMLTAAVQEASRGGVRVTQGEWIYAAVTCVVTAAAVYAAPKNADPAPKDEGGQANFLVLACAVAVGFILGVIIVNALHLR